MCLNQFHDIIPGSSIGPVYVESQAQYAEVRAIGERVMDALRELDEVAYVRFASVYLSFEDLGEFREIIDRLQSGREQATKPAPN